MVIDMNSSYR